MKFKPLPSLILQRSKYPFNRKVVRKAMLDADLRITDLAHRFHVTTATISFVVDGKTRNLLLQQAIAAALRVPLETLWDTTKPKTREQKRTHPSSPTPTTAAPALAASPQE